MTIEEEIQRGAQLLKDSEIENPRFEAELLIDLVLDVGRVKLYTEGNKEITPLEHEHFQSLLKRRAGGEPYAYISGHKEFMGIDFLVNSDVLIPRPDTESIVETSLKIIGGKSMTVLDLCSGSGAIGISLAVYAPQINITFSDISEAAIEMTKKNAARKQVLAEYYISDLFSEIPADKKFDLIVSNPPYIPDAEIDRLERDVSDYEPRLALSGGESGYLIYEKIIPQAFDFLSDGGSLVLECGFDQASELSDQLERAGYEVKEIIIDLAGLQRGVWAEKI